MSTLKIIQKEITLPDYRRGFHLITDKIYSAVPELAQFQQGTAQIFIKHTSASLTLNENADRDVRTNFETFFNHLVPESFPRFEHTSEGRDDMPAHLKSSLLGASVSVPITNGRFNLGTWQGIYLCEHRDYGGRRRLVITLMGE